MSEQQKEIVSSLRNLADYLDRNEFDLSRASFNIPEVWVFCENVESFLSNTKKMGGFTRNFDEYSAQLEKKFGNAKFILHSSRESVCEKVKIGVTVIPAEEEKIIAAKPERVIDKFEYKCPDSLLKEN